MIFCKLGGIPGDASIKTEGYDNGEWIIADSFGFGVEREMKESGEKGGTEDINIGVGELQECTVSKSMDWASTQLAQFAINGNSPGTAEIHFVEVAAGDETGKPFCYLKFKLERCFVRSWSLTGDADDRPTEEVAFLYNKIAFNYAKTSTGKDWKACEIEMAWDNTKQKKWDDAGIKWNENKGGFQPD